MSTPTPLPVKLQPSNLRPVAYRILSKKHGLNIQTDALVLLTEAVSTRFGTEWKGGKSQVFLEDIAKIWKHQDRGLFLDGVGLKQVLKEIVNKERKLSVKLERQESSNLGDSMTKAARSDTLVDMNQYEDEGKLNWEDFYKIITPDVQPCFEFKRNRKQFGLSTRNNNQLQHNLHTSIEYFNQRFHLIRDRLSRNENFQKKSFSSISLINTSNQNRNSTYEITLIKNVLGRDGSKFVLFGLLSKNVNGDYILEDSSDYIELNILQAYKLEGSFYCVGMFVIVEGIYSASGGSMANDGNVISGCFHVSNIGQPPAERRDVSLENYGNLDFLGINDDGQEQKLANGKINSNMTIKINKSLKKKLVSLEKSLIEHKFIILGSNCFLDDIKILNGLTKLFGKIEESIIEDETPPLAIVMVGSFISQAFTATYSTNTTISNSENYKSNFDNLADILSKFPTLIKKTKFILIPGPNDPWQSTNSLGGSNLNILPQKPISKVFINRLERLLPKGNLIMGWNPTRIGYLSQEMVFIKDEIMNKFKRNDIIFESDLENERQILEQKETGGELNIENINTDEVHLLPKVKQARKLVKTLLDQGNLQPFLSNLKVINTNYNSTMRIEPLPTTIILFDSNFENFDVTYNGCKVINLTKLISNNNNRKLNFAEYYPSQKKFTFKDVYF